MISPAPSASRVEQYAAEAAAAHDITPEDLMGRGRAVKLVRARCVVWKRLFDEGFSMNAIALAVGRHHTTVMHALRKPETATSR